MSQDKQPHSTHQADSIMLILVLILAVLGLLILFSASESWPPVQRVVCSRAISPCY